jgi:hypothetical protein
MGAITSFPKSPRPSKDGVVFLAPIPFAAPRSVP